MDESQEGHPQVEHTAQGDEHMHVSDIQDSEHDGPEENISQSRSRLHAKGEQGPGKEGRRIQIGDNVGIVTPRDVVKRTKKTEGGGIEISKTKEDQIETGNDKDLEGKFKVLDENRNSEIHVKGNLTQSKGEVEKQGDGSMPDKVKDNWDDNKIKDKGDDNNTNKVKDKGDNNNNRVKDKGDDNDTNMPGDMAEMEGSDISPDDIDEPVTTTESTKTEETNQNVTKNSTHLSENEPVEKMEAANIVEPSGDPGAGLSELLPDIKRSKEIESDLREVAEKLTSKADSKEMISRRGETMEANDNQNLTQVQSSKSPTFDPIRMPPKNGDSGVDENLHNDDSMSTTVVGKKEEKGGGEVVNALRLLTLEEKARALGLEVGEEEEAMREREGRQQSFFEKEISSSSRRGEVEACFSLLR